MAAADLRDELSCSICQDIYTDPVMLPCGHNFCQGCIGRVLDTQEGTGGYSCLECREVYEERPVLHRNRTLNNIIERFRATQSDPGETGILCTYCIHASIPAAQSCLQCEASLCVTHLDIHNKSLEHFLIKPIACFESRKCSSHNKLLEYYCCEDGASMCESCCLDGEHRGHRAELLSEASEKKKEQLRKILEKLTLEREKVEERVLNLQEHRREAHEKAVGITEQISDLFRGIREHMNLLEEQLHIQLSLQKVMVSLKAWDLIQELTVKKDKLSWKIHHIEELCNMADPLTVLQERESHGADFCGAERADNEEEYNVEDKHDTEEDTERADNEEEYNVEDKHDTEEDTEGADNEEEYNVEDKHDTEEDTERADNETREGDDWKAHAVGNVDVEEISETLLAGLAGIMSWVRRWWVYGQEATDLVLNTSSAANDVSVSEDGKYVCSSETIHCHPYAPERFESYQVLSTRSFSTGRHYWDLDVSEMWGWFVGVAYPSIDRLGGQSIFGNNNKSWHLGLDLMNDKYSVRHDWVDTELPYTPSCWRIRVLLDYEAGRLSFYERSEPIRHLHTFTAKFTEPLHAAFCIGRGWVRIIS